MFRSPTPPLTYPVVLVPLKRRATGAHLQLPRLPQEVLDLVQRDHDLLHTVLGDGLQGGGRARSGANVTASYSYAAV